MRVLFLVATALQVVAACVAFKYAPAISALSVLAAAASATLWFVTRKKESDSREPARSR
ncbi:hypothetical protein [Paenarthrobacter sp. YJN-5]|uniref:hypothetical protein n=1 Tax=Paenarthrobacter sp. YJN-5 TaxID=2735316 RepID=UPI0018781EB2|nr:hypothetical protein [Paenarthrobacter sp. YJN-5]QOT15762.1 hypothetical protein HMI59_03590 [Paenarthrobacter sp. YJN-5]